MRLPVELGHERRVRIDAIPKILQPQIFVRRMLVVIVIDYGQANDRRAEHVGKHVKRHTAAGHGQHHYGCAGGSRRGGDHRFGGGRGHVGAQRRVAVIPLQLDDALVL